MPSHEVMPTLVVLATRNRKKGEELAQLLDPAWEPNPMRGRIKFQTLDAYPNLPEVVEDGLTFAANARKKASETARAVGAWVLADDSGLAVDALKGAPGIYSARYAGTHGNDQENNEKVLRELEAVPDEERGAAFVCALALADPAGTVRLEAEASCRGRITHVARGSNGFGYDPLFEIREYHKTFGELSALVKHQLSHRSRACARMRPGLWRLVPGGGAGQS
jgi:XTP/dITP diphosphohydrolase